METFDVIFGMVKDIEYKLCLLAAQAASFYYLHEEGALNYSAEGSFSGYSNSMHVQNCELVDLLNQFVESILVSTSCYSED